MKRVLLVILCLFLSSGCFAEELVKIKCDYKTGKKGDFISSGEVVRKYTGEGSYSTDTVYYYLDDKNKKLYDSDKKLITTITYNNDKIMIFEGNKLSDEDFIIGQCITLDRNTGEYSGSHIIEAQINGKLCRSNTPVYGSCELIENKKKF